MHEYIKIGKLVATHGTGGELIFVHNLGNQKNWKHLEVLFMEERKGAFLPYFVEKVQLKKDNELLVKLEDINSKEAAKKVYPKEVWLKQETFRKLVGKSAPIGLLGYMLMENNNDIGKIIEVIEQPHQVLCVVNYKSSEAMIPLHEETLLHIDHAKKTVNVKLPDGLLDIYAG